MERLVAFQGKSKLRKAVLNMLVKQQSEDQHKLAHSVFLKMDDDRSGVIDKKEIESAFKRSKSLKLKDMDDNKIHRMISEIDYNENSQIEYTEFVAATLDKDVLENEDTLRGLFNLFDLDNDGSIDKMELVKAFSKFGRDITIAEIDAILKTHDLKGIGQIDFDSFKHMI